MISIHDDEGREGEREEREGNQRAARKSVDRGKRQPHSYSRRTKKKKKKQEKTSGEGIHV